ncbi:MAG: hyperosmotically inducible periplasmic protein [Verrucomicrobiota bacterium]|nr:hyperosmotically inducible periplasmic protein [Verrucomicrobiota bacterium]
MPLPGFSRKRKAHKTQMKKLLLPLFASLLMVYSSQGQQVTPTPRDPAASDSTEADNTKRNSSEQNKSTDTAEKQSNSKDDLALTQKIRQAVMNDGSLSMNAKNVKIIAQDGKITLKGPVDNQQEKDVICSKAGETAGKDNVDNQLEVKSEKK